jgi:hypothetical protein
MTALPYEPLDASRRQVRLMRITSRSTSTAIHCELQHIDLDADADPPYDALSYAWGSSKDKEQIQLAVRLYPSEPTSSTFLQVYRQRADRGWIWIDQLCIDQHSVLEKNHQVSMMGDIYLKARRTLIWLGVDPDHGLAPSLFEKLPFYRNSGTWSEALVTHT